LLTKSHTVRQWFQSGAAPEPCQPVRITALLVYPTLSTRPQIDVQLGELNDTGIVVPSKLVNPRQIENVKCEIRASIPQRVFWKVEYDPIFLLPTGNYLNSSLIILHSRFPAHLVNPLNKPKSANPFVSDHWYGMNELLLILATSRWFWYYMRCNLIMLTMYGIIGMWQPARIILHITKRLSDKIIHPCHQVHPPPRRDLRLLWRLLKPNFFFFFFTDCTRRENYKWQESITV